LLFSRKHEAKSYQGQEKNISIAPIPALLQLSVSSIVLQV